MRGGEVDIEPLDGIAILQRSVVNWDVYKPLTRLGSRPLSSMLKYFAHPASTLKCIMGFLECGTKRVDVKFIYSFTH